MPPLPISLISRSYDVFDSPSAGFSPQSRQSHRDFVSQQMIQPARPVTTRNGSLRLISSLGSPQPQYGSQSGFMFLPGRQTTGQPIEINPLLTCRKLILIQSITRSTILFEIGLQAVKNHINQQLPASRVITLRSGCLQIFKPGISRTAEQEHGTPQGQTCRPGFFLSQQLLDSLLQQRNLTFISSEHGGENGGSCS
jgi:hypothetical protein